MKKKFENFGSLLEWMIKNGDRKQRYYYSLNVITCEMEVSDKWIRKSKTKIVRHPEALKTPREGSWYRNISDAFGGMICKSTVRELFGQSFAESIPYDRTASNPMYKCASPMKLYFADRIRYYKGGLVA